MGAVCRQKSLIVTPPRSSVRVATTYFSTPSRLTAQVMVAPMSVG